MAGPFPGACFPEILIQWKKLHLLKLPFQHYTTMKETRILGCAKSRMLANEMVLFCQNVLI